MTGFPLSAIYSWSPMVMDKLHFLSEAAENDFWNNFLKYKGRGPFKFSKEYPAAKHYTDIYRFVLLLTHLSYRWIIISCSCHLTLLFPQVIDPAAENGALSGWCLAVKTTFCSSSVLLPLPVRGEEGAAMVELYHGTLSKEPLVCTSLLEQDINSMNGR
jgi:hypothetical protein